MQNPVHIISTRVKRALGFPYSGKWLKAVIAAVFISEAPGEQWEVNCLVTDDSAIRKLNLHYRGIDRATDVLSFALSEGEGQGTGAIPPPGYDTKYGEIVVSWPRVVSHSRELGHGGDKELMFVLVHGCLHLLGYNHDKPKTAAKMRGKEEELMKMLNEKGLGQ
jgi:probable rRNA maturation factor